MQASFIDVAGIHVAETLTNTLQWKHFYITGCLLTKKKQRDWSTAYNAMHGFQSIQG